MEPLVAGQDRTGILEYLKNFEICEIQSVTTIKKLISTTAWSWHTSPDARKSSHATIYPQITVKLFESYWLRDNVTTTCAKCHFDLLPTDDFCPICKEKTYLNPY